MTNENHSLSEPLVVFWNRFRTLLSSPIDAASLAVFRICMGLVMVYEAYRYLIPKNGVNRIQSLFSQDHWHFPHHGFEWVTPMSETGMHLVFWGLGIVGAMVAVGLFYRAAATLMFLAFTYIFLLDAALYLNHFYLICLLSFLLIWLPANHCWSVDAWWKRRKQCKSLSGVPLASPVPGQRETLAAENTGKASCTLSSDSVIPFWPVFLLRAQLFIVYFYAGIAKLGADWLSGEALRGAHQRVYTYLSGVTTLPAWLTVEKIGLGMNWGGLVFDLAIGFLLICRRTRLLGIVFMFIFHAINHFVFPIGVFPVMAFTASLIFFDPDWPRCVISWLRRPRFVRPDFGWLVGGTLAIPVLGAALGWKRKSQAEPHRLPPGRLRGVIMAFVSIWIVTHCLIPLRHFLVPGNTEWTAEHQRFSWRMMLKSKTALNVNFDVHDAEILTTDKQGGPSINWKRWPASWPRMMHMIVTSHAVPWRQLPNMVFVYEPYIGYRVIENPLAKHKAGEGSIAARRQAIEERWLAKLGRKPQVHAAISLDNALGLLRMQISQRQTTGEDEVNEKNLQLDRISRIREISNIKDRSVDDMIEFSDLIEVLVSSPFGGELARQQLGETKPFAVQGARSSPNEFLVVNDPDSQRGDVVKQLAKLNDGKPFVVLVDTNRLRDTGWKQLPKAMMLLDMGQPRLIWNCFPDLHTHQVQVMTKHPDMIHQYANRIGDLWQKESGRRPEVRALAVAKMNKHEPQLIVDPSVDLASASLNMVGHNPWIYHLKSPEAHLKPSTVAQAPNRSTCAPGQPLARMPHREVVKRYADGTPKEGIQWNGSKQNYTAVKWHENGQIALLAEYKNNQPHGKQTKWRADGTLLLEMHFVNGKPHGLATSWDESGKLAEKAQFFEGRQVSFEENSKASAIPATAERTERTKVDSSLR